MCPEGKHTADVWILVNRIIVLNQLVIVFENFILFKNLTNDIRYPFVIIIIPEFVPALPR